MDISRHEVAEGFEQLGFFGLLSALTVILNQWLSGTYTGEADWLVYALATCVLLASLLAGSADPALRVVSQLLFYGGLGYLSMLPFVGADIGWAHWPRLSIMALAALVAAVAGWGGMRYIGKRGGQQGSDHEQNPP